MKKDINEGLDVNVKEKMTKNLVYLGMISIFMAFAGLSSAYIVSMGDAFWLKFPFPKAFWVSTAIIIIASFTFHFAITSMKKGKITLSKSLVITTTVLAIAFGFSQYKGYKQLVKRGAYFVSSVVVNQGRYGDYYEIRMNGDLLTVDGNDYIKKGKVLNAAEQKQLKDFAQNFLKADSTYPSNIKGFGTTFNLTYESKPISLVDGKLELPDGTKLLRSDLIRLRDLARNVVAGRGDFFLAGKIGKDFKLYYHSEEVTYKDRILFYKGKPLSKPLQLKLLSSKDNATSYLYIITFLHLLHVIGMIFYMIFFSRRTLLNEFTPENTIGMRATAIFWHFLGALWVYLLLFLLFIH